jgi:hypothetical protein
MKETLVNPDHNNTGEKKSESFQEETEMDFKELIENKVADIEARIGEMELAKDNRIKEIQNKSGLSGEKIQEIKARLDIDDGLNKISQKAKVILSKFIDKLKMATAIGMATMVLAGAIETGKAHAGEDPGFSSATFEKSASINSDDNLGKNVDDIISDVKMEKKTIEDVVDDFKKYQEETPKKEEIPSVEILRPTDKFDKIAHKGKSTKLSDDIILEKTFPFDVESTVKKIFTKKNEREDLKIEKGDKSISETAAFEEK